MDSIPRNVVAKFVNNMMKMSFVQTVPSKFGTIMDEASDPIGIEVSDIHKDADGKYDVRIANNGVAYILNRVVPPISYNIVSTPALLEKQFSVINWAIQDKKYLNQNYYAYLQASTANYALFLPTDEAFDFYYVDPASLVKNSEGVARNARVLHFYTTMGANDIRDLNCSSFKYTPSTGEIGADSTKLKPADVTTQIVDILNYHTVVLGSGTKERIGDNGNHYYKTKHGGTVYVTNAQVDGEAHGGAPVVGDRKHPTITSVRDFSGTNGMTYVIDRVIEAPQSSVYSILNEASGQQFSEFLSLCDADASEDIKQLRQWATGYSANKVDTVYNIFTTGGIDKIVRFMNSYNYTVYAPNNNAMQTAYSRGLPTWDEVLAVRNTYEGSPDEATGKAKAKAMIDEINRFIRYHVQDNSIYADGTVETAEYQTSCVAGTTNSYQRLNVSGGDGKLYVRDNHGDTQTIDAKGGRLVNQMARDYQFTVSGSTRKIDTSSFAAVHEIDAPLNFHTDTERYDTGWNN